MDMVGAADVLNFTDVYFFAESFSETETQT